MPRASSPAVPSIPFYPKHPDPLALWLPLVEIMGQQWPMPHGNWDIGHVFTSLKWQDHQKYPLSAILGQICFEVAKETAMQSVLVEDQAITEAQRLLWKSHRQLVEPAGGTALAALISGAYKPEKDEKIAVLVCGANIAPDPFQ